MCDIASNGLVYALDPIKEGYQHDDPKALSALGNILETQQFDAIPIIWNHKGMVTHLARRKLHDGDEHEVHILTKSEVECVSRDSSILECMFRILANQHHILLLEDSEGRVTDILTISMLNSEKVKSYLRLKVSHLSEDDWNWNSDYLSNSKKVDIDYAAEIFSQIEELAELLSEDYIERTKSVPKDIDVSKKIVKLLSDLQPLKPFSGNIESLSLVNEGFYLEASVETKPEHTAKEIQHEWGGSLSEIGGEEYDKDEKKEIRDLAFNLFTKANDWDELLFRKNDNSLIKLSKTDENEIIESDVVEIDEGDDFFSIARELFENRCKMLVVKNIGSKWPGIITIHDFALSTKVQNYLLSLMTKIETNCREKLVSEGIQYFYDKRSKKKKLISVVNFNDVIETLNDRGLLSKRGKQNKKLDVIRFCRNKLVHEIIGSDLDELPKYLEYIFLKGFLYSEELYNDDLNGLFAIDDHSHDVFRNIVALDAFVFGSEYLIGSRTSKELRKLVDKFDDIEINNNQITIKLDSESKNVNNALDKKMNLGTWRSMMESYYPGISEISIIDRQD